MFVTNPEFKVPLASALGGADQYYRAIQLCGRMPWFLVTLRLNEANASFLHTICCALDVDLLDLLKAPQAQSVTSVQMVALSVSGDPTWQMRRAVRIWRTTDSLGHQHLTFQDENGAEFNYVVGFKQAPPTEPRELIFSRG